MGPRKARAISRRPKEVPIWLQTANKAMEDPVNSIKLADAKLRKAGYGGRKRLDIIDALLILGKPEYIVRAVAAKVGSSQGLTGLRLANFIDRRLYVKAPQYAKPAQNKPVFKK